MDSDPNFFDVPPLPAALPPVTLRLEDGFLTASFEWPERGEHAMKAEVKSWDEVEKMSGLLCKSVYLTMMTIKAGKYDAIMEWQAKRAADIDAPLPQSTLR